MALPPKTITALSAGTAIQDSDPFESVQGGISIKQPASALNTYILSKFSATPQAPGNGGTGITVYTTGDVIYASGGSALAKLGIAAVGNALISTGALPAWGKIDLTATVSGILPVANGGTASATASGARTNLGLGTAATLDFSTDGTLAANSDSLIATQKAVKTYVGTAVTGLLDFKGSTDCSGNPDYPAASQGDAYVVSVAGKIGGALGVTVAVGDVYFATADNAGGSQLLVGASWDILEHTLQGALLSANNLSDVASVATSRSNLGAAASGAVTASGLTQNTGKLLGRTTASTGAIEEISAGATLTFSAGALGVDLTRANTWSGKQDFSAGGDLTPATTPTTTAIGYLGAPQNIGLDSGNVTLAMTDCGKHVYHTDGNARDLTIPANGSVAFPVGTVIAGSNENAAGVVTLKITTDTLRWGSSTGQRTLAANATFSLLKVQSTVWRLTGDGIT